MLVVIGTDYSGSYISKIQCDHDHNHNGPLNHFIQHDSISIYNYKKSDAIIYKFETYTMIIYYWIRKSAA